MNRNSRGLAWMVAAAGLAAACGGASFTTGGVSADGGADGGTGGGGSSGGSSSSSGSTSSSSSSGGSSSGSSGGSSGGSGSSGGEGGASSSSGSSEGGAPGDSGAISTCPDKAPAASSACTKAGLTCEWGASPVSSCDEVATCTNGEWIFQAAGSDCSPSASCPSFRFPLPHVRRRFTATTQIAAAHAAAVIPPRRT